MTTPNKKLFEDWRQFVIVENSTIPLCEYRRYEGFEIKEFRDAAESFVSAVVEYKVQSNNRLNQQPIIKWLDNEGFRKIYAKMLGRRRPIDITEEQLKDRLIERLHAPSDASMCFREVERIRDSYAISNYWIAHFISIFNNYLYLDHDAIQGARKVYHAKLTEIWRAAQDIEPYLLSVGYHTKSLIAATQRLERFGPMPGERASKYKAEHYFVREMYRINMKYFGAPKPEPIADMMALPGFNHQFETRQVARLCASIRVANSERRAAQIAMAEKQRNERDAIMTCG